MMSVEQLRSRVLGQVLVPSDAGYEIARMVANRRVDRHPAVVARCAGPCDVVAVLRYAQERGLPVAVRGGGQNVAGWGTCDDGIVVDLSPMKAVRVDVAARATAAQPGVTWDEFDAATQRFGLAAPGGHGPEVSIAGYTLGGGIGELSRTLGLACDNVESFDVVTAAGRQIRVDAGEHPDLFWALRGGGGNFGVVTSLRFRVHPVTDITCGPMVFAADQTAAALKAARDWVSAAPDAASFCAVAWTAPPVPFVPETFQFEPCLLLLPSWSGRPEEAQRVLAPLRATAPAPALDAVRRIPYSTYPSFFRRPSGMGRYQAYARGELLRELGDSTIDDLVNGWRAASPQVSIVLGALGGAIGRVGRDETAFAHRDAAWFVECNAQWRPGIPGEDLIRIVRQLWQALAPVTAGPYVNLLPDPEPEWVRAAYGPTHLARLVAVKTTYDPDNVFRFNANIRPDSSPPVTRSISDSVHQ
ncbi:MAG: FAD-binding oxidoreductase [Pseudonocardiaceae bacterium]